MKIMSSYGIEIKNMNKIFYPTIAVYNKAVSFCIYMFPLFYSSVPSSICSTALLISQCR